MRAVGEELGLPEEIVWRQPFPGPGLAVRIVGTITPERLEILRRADAIVVEEIRRAGLYREIWQSFAVLPAVRTVGVMGDGRTYEYPIVVRAVTSDDAMTADWARLPARAAGADLVADHQRGPRRQPGRLRHHEQATRHHRVGVTMNVSELEATARALVAPGKGILAADESSGTIKKRFDSIGVESTEDNRRAYRDLLFTTEGVEEFISGVILFDETIRQSATTAPRSRSCSPSKGIIPGIKVDTGAKPLALAAGARRHRGPRRAARAAGRVPGARRALRQVARHLHDHRRLPSQYCDRRQRRTRWRATRRCARRPASCRSSSPRCSWTARTRSSGAPTSPRRCSRRVFHALYEQRCAFEGLLLKPNMVLPGYDCRSRRPTRSRRGDRAVLPARRAGGGAGHRVPVRRPDRRAGHRAPRRDEQAWARTRGSSASRTAARSSPALKAWKGEPRTATPLSVPSLTGRR